MKLRHPLQWVFAAIVLLLTAVLIKGFATTPNIEWSVVGHYLFSRDILAGVLLTLVLTVLGMGFASVIGLGLALMRLSPNRVLQALSTGYIWFFRGIPALVLLLLLFNLALVFDKLTIGVPFTDVVFVGASTNELITPFVAAVVGLTLAEAAYMAEIIRAGIMSVDKGQFEAGMSLGMTRSYMLRRITLPQAMRVIIPPVGNEALTLLKTTSLVAVISGQELLARAQLISSDNLRVVELLLVATFWYMVITSVLSFGQVFIERRFGRGFSPRDSTAPTARRFSFRPGGGV